MVAMLPAMVSSSWAAMPCPGDKQIAFPSAEGFGRCAQGGRGGTVHEVTNLNASGPGSLVACIAASGPRTCVFRVAGTIDLGDRNVYVWNPYLTIAGQTAPGDGIQIKNGNLTVITHDVVVRYLRVRPGIITDGESNNALHVVGYAPNIGHDVIIDHCSFSWAVDQVAGIWGVGTKNVTFQWTFITESLNCANHPKGCHGMGLLVGGGVTAVSLHHNLFTSHFDRNPWVHSGTADYVNNVVYNWGNTIGPHFSSHSGAISVNVVRNYFKPGPSSKSVDRPVRLIGGKNYTDERLDYFNASGVFLLGNIDPNTRPADTYPEMAVAHFDTGSSPPNMAVAASRFGFPSLASETDAFRAYEDVLNQGGATKPIRDPVDTRIVSEVRAGGGKIINSPTDVGGWPTLGSAPAPVDSDRDGIPDTWEVSRGLDPKSPADGAALTASGYSNLELFLNALAAGTAVGPSHPADVNADFKITRDELTAYEACWKNRTSCPPDVTKVPLDFAVRAGYLVRASADGKYRYQSGTSFPRCWVPVP